MKKGAFIVGTQYGQGVVTCRTGQGWSARFSFARNSEDTEVYFGAA